MIIKQSSRILNAFGQGGWNLYAKAGGDILDEVIAKMRMAGPAREIDEGPVYNVWPKGFEFADQDTLAARIGQKILSCYIAIPDSSWGLAVYEWAGGDRTDDVLGPKTKVDFLGFQAQRVEKVRLISPFKFYMNRDDFALALEQSLTDLTKILGKR